MGTAERRACRSVTDRRKVCPAATMQISNPQRDDLRQPARPFMLVLTSSRRRGLHATVAIHGGPAVFVPIKGANQGQAHGHVRCGFLLLCDQRIDHGGMLMLIPVVLIVVGMPGLVIILIVTDRGMWPMAMIDLCELLHPAAVAHETAMQAGHLRPAHREQREKGKEKPVMTEAGHASVKLAPLNA